MKFMHQLNTIVLSLIISIATTTCNKDDAVNTLPLLPDYTGTGNLELVWKNYIDEKKVEAYNINPILNSNGDILVSSFADNVYREPMLLFDGNTGALKWKWDDYFRDEEGFWNKSHVAENDILVLCSHNATYALNIVTGQTIWRHYSDTMWGSPFIFSDKKGYVYHSFKGEDGNYTNYIFRTKIDHLNWELVCTNSDSVDQTFNRREIDNMTFATNNKGEQLLIYELMRSPDAYDPRTTMACYNINQKKYEWVKSYTEKYNEWDAPQMLTDNKRIYVYASKGSNAHLLAIDIENGEIIWDNSVPDFGVNMFLFGSDIISVCNRSSPIVSYNAQSGSVNWKQAFSLTDQVDINFSFNSDIVYKNYLISTQCKKLLFVELTKGSVLFNKQAAKGYGCMLKGVAVNALKGVFYVGDDLYVNCFKLPSGVK